MKAEHIHTLRQRNLFVDDPTVKCIGCNRLLTRCATCRQLFCYHCDEATTVQGRKQVFALRDKTGASLQVCFQALITAKWDDEKAFQEISRKQQKEV